MEFWAVVGDRDSRKTATIRSLTGAGRRVAKWQIEVAGSTVYAYVELSAPQEQNPPVQPADVVKRVHAHSTVTHMVIALRHRGRGGTPDAIAYLDHFTKIAGWKCSGILINSPEFGSTPIAGQYPALVDYAPSQSFPFAAPNAIANVVRRKWLL